MLTTLLAGFGLCFSLIAVPGAQNVFLLREGIRRAGEGRSAVLALAAVCFASDVILISAGVAGFGAAIDAAPWLFHAARWAGVVFLLGYGLFAAWRALRGTGEAIDATATDHPEGRRGRGRRPQGGMSSSHDDAHAEDSARTAPVGHVDSLPADSARPSLGRPGVSARPTHPATGSSGSATTATLARSAVAARRTVLPAMLTCLAITWLNPHTYLDTVLLLGSVSTSYGDASWLFAIGAITGSGAWFGFITIAARFAARWLRSPRSWRVLDGTVAVIMLALAAALAV